MLQGNMPRGMDESAAAIPPIAAYDTAKDNLAAWHGELGVLRELSVLQIESIAKDFAANATDIEGCRHLAARLLDKELSPHPTERAQQLSERLTLCRQLKELPLTLNEGDNAPQSRQAAPDEVAKVAILNSPIFSSAIAAFSAVLPKTEPLFCRSFTDICEEIAAGRAAFGILPLEDSAEGKLFRLYEQIEHFELHIACTADITEPGGKTVRIALLYKSEPPSITPCGERILECLLYAENECTLTDLITVAAAFDLSLRRIDSLPLSYREDDFVQHLVFRTVKNEIKGFLVYLSLFLPRVSITADYINIKAQE